MDSCYLRGISMSLSRVIRATTAGEIRRVITTLRHAARGYARREGHRAMGALSRASATTVSLPLRLHPWCIRSI